MQNCKLHFKGRGYLAKLCQKKNVLFFYLTCYLAIKLNLDRLLGTRTHLLV